MSLVACGACGGDRLRAESLAVRLGEWNIAALTHLTLDALGPVLEGIGLEGNRRLVADRILKEVRELLGFLRDVGVGYLELDRPAGRCRPTGIRGLARSN